MLSVVLVAWGIVSSLQSITCALRAGLLLALKKSSTLALVLVLSNPALGSCWGHSLSECRGSVSERYNTVMHKLRAHFWGQVKHTLCGTFAFVATGMCTK